tara:strand:+ start:728 stop:1084 length:357 start_codon:yes stop_codon:yes gene_type:complete
MADISKDNHQQKFDNIMNQKFDRNKAEDLIKFYEEKIKEQISNNDKSIDIDLNKVKEESNLKNQQNETNKAAYLEKYLYLIIKILFFIVIISLFLYKFSDKIGFSSILNKTTPNIRNL